MNEALIQVASASAGCSTEVRGLVQQLASITHCSLWCHQKNIFFIFFYQLSFGVLMRFQTVGFNGSGVGGELNTYHKSDLVIERLELKIKWEERIQFLDYLPSVELICVI